jgi:hypothetical protein
MGASDGIIGAIAIGPRGTAMNETIVRGIGRTIVVVIDEVEAMVGRGGMMTADVMAGDGMVGGVMVGEVMVGEVMVGEVTLGEVMLGDVTVGDEVSGRRKLNPTLELPTLFLLPTLSSPSTTDLAQKRAFRVCRLTLLVSHAKKWLLTTMSCIYTHLFVQCSTLLTLS